mgnify:CR=1 FL=1
MCIYKFIQARYSFLQILTTNKELRKTGWKPGIECYKTSWFNETDSQSEVLMMWNFIFPFNIFQPF